LPRASTASNAKTTRVRIAALVVLAFVAVLIYAIDQLSKIAITNSLEVGEQVPFVGELLQLHYVKNPGAAFSLGTGTTWIFAIIATAVVIFIVIFAPRIRSLGWAVLFGLLLGGNSGNLTDRLTREPGFGVGHVIDFFQLYGFPAIFNVADTAIVASMVMFVILTVRGVRLDGTKTPKTVPADDGASATTTETGASDAAATQETP
jgi:signal peptidase II